MKPLQLVTVLALAATVFVAPVLADADRVGTITAAVWCNDGAGPGFAPRISEATLCQRNPEVPGPSQCPEFVDRVLLEFNTEHVPAAGRIRVSIEHFAADGTLLETFEGAGWVNDRRADVDIDIDRAALPGEWMQAAIRLPKSARKLTGLQCAVGSLTVLE